jgi:hypothetical protein
MKSDILTCYKNISTELHFLDHTIKKPQGMKKVV